MRNDHELPIVIEERGGGLGTFLLGAVVGAGVALLLAPRTGRETQRELASALSGLGRAAGGRAGGARESVTGLVDRARDAVDDGVGRVRGAVDEGRTAARSASSELRRRVDEAKAAFNAGRRGEPPPPSPRPAAPARVQPAADEVVVTEVATEPDAGDLAR